MTRLGPLLAATAALVVALTACGPDDDPGPNFSSVTPTASASTSSSPTASPSPSVPTTGPNVSPGEVAPTQPAAAAENTTTGALSFAAFYLQSLDWAFATQDADFLGSFYSPGCTTCESRLTYLKGLFDNGGSVQGGRLTIQEQEIVANDGRLGAAMAVSTAVAVSASTVVASQGAAPSADPGTPFITLTTWLVRDGSSWKIVEERYA